MGSILQQQGLSKASMSISNAISTAAIHADDILNSGTDVAPPLHVATTFRYARDPEKLVPANERNEDLDSIPSHDAHVYSRHTAPNTTRLETILTSILQGRCLVYSSGLAAFHALLVFLNPRRIAIGAGYHGCHGVIGVVSKLTGLQKVDIHADDAAWDAAGLGAGDVVHVESPLNPTGEAYNIDALARRAHARGAYLTIDATFAPPPLQQPFVQGADVVMHSGTKYLGGHSDMLCGILAVQRRDWWHGLSQERVFLGSVMGSLEGWLGIRSVRTLELRVRRQSATATALALRIDAALHAAVGSNGASIAPAGPAGAANGDAGATPTLDAGTAALFQRNVLRVAHASVQARHDASAAAWLAQQMPQGYGPVFALYLRDSASARAFPSGLQLFHHATSLGGVESLIEWRRMSDTGCDERLLRVSVGIEDLEDLWEDLVAGLRAIDARASGVK